MNRTLLDVAEEVQVDVARVLKVLGDPNRLKIIELLRNGERCQCEIIPSIGQSQPTISRHLRILEENKILVNRKDGVRVLYRIANPNVLRIIELAASIT
jgi:DNA-binding transcriptional ArsR family regulator